MIGLPAHIIFDDMCARFGIRAAIGKAKAYLQSDYPQELREEKLFREELTKIIKQMEEK